MNTLTGEEKIRYSRHLVLAEIGNEGQLRLKSANVLVVGAGGLGAPVLLYLGAAGVGHIGIIDADVVDATNLQRQVIYTTADIRRQKAVTAAEKVRQLNPLIRVKAYPQRLDASNALDIIRDFDIVVDCSDNFPTRYLINDACVLLGKAMVFGSILRFEGHVAVFNSIGRDGNRGCTYRDIFPEPPLADNVQNCEEAGVMGVLPGLVGAIQASETIKLLCNIGEALQDKLLIIDMLTMEQTVVKVTDRGMRHIVKNLIDYEDFCGISRGKSKSLTSNQRNTMKEITVQELKKLKDTGADFQLIDVREPHEYDVCNLDGELIPMSEIPYNVDKIAKDKQVVIHCRSGKRSGDMLLWLEKNHGFSNLYNLKGGILAWAKEIDPSMPTY